MQSTEARGWGVLTPDGTGIMKYVGLALVLAWHYSLWFVPKSFHAPGLLTGYVTAAWLLALLSAGCTSLLLAWRMRHFPAEGLQATYYWPAAGIGSLATLLVTHAAFMPHALLVAWISAIALGACSAALWMEWGECLARQTAHFSLQRLGPTYGLVLIVCVGVCALLPEVLAPWWSASIPLASGILLDRSARGVSLTCNPAKLPEEVASRGDKARVTVLAVSFLGALVCYYTVAIVPWGTFHNIGIAYTRGILLGGAMIFLLAMLQARFRPDVSAFKVYPWLLWGIIVACLLCLVDPRHDSIAFLVSVALNAIIEILLVMYMGILTWRGYATAISAFSLSCATIRIGMATGDSIAMLLERSERWHGSLVNPVFAVLIALLVGAVMTLIRQEYVIESLTLEPQTLSERDLLAQEIAEQYRLSARECEVMVLLGRGYTAAAVAEELVLSPHTVNTHVQHIYSKIGIHKRNELIRMLDRPATAAKAPSRGAAARRLGGP